MLKSRLKLVIENTFEHGLHYLILDLAADISLHSKGFACWCWAIHHHITVFAINERVTEFFSTLLKDLVLALTISLLLVKDIFKVEVPLSIVEVVVGEDLQTLLVLLHIYHILALFFTLEQRSYSCRHLYKDIIFWLLLVILFFAYCLLIVTLISRTLTLEGFNDLDIRVVLMILLSHVYYLVVLLGM